MDIKDSVVVTQKNNTKRMVGVLVERWITEDVSNTKQQKLKQRGGQIKEFHIKTTAEVEQIEAENHTT